MIRKLIRQMLTAQVLSALTVSVCLLVDQIMIGRFLGVEALASYSLANPILLIIGALGSMLAAGVQVVCSRSLGRGSQEETNAGYSSALAVTVVISVVLAALVLLLRNPISTLMGADPALDPELHRMTADYMAGYVIGAPGSIGALVLIPFLQMAGKSSLLIAAVAGMTVVDIGLDLLNGLVLHWGMFGMGLASSLSYYVAMVIAMFFFLSPKCVFRFSRKQVTRGRIVELFKGGVPTVFTMASTVVTVFALNKILLHLGSSEAVAAYTVIMTIGNSSNCIATGTGGVSLTLSGVFFNEEDRTALRELIRQLARYSVLLGLVMGAGLVIFAPVLVSLFLPDPGATQDMAVLGLRIFAAGCIPCCLNNALKNMYQATGRARLTELISTLEGAVFPVLAAVLMSLLMGVTGVWFFFVLGEAAALVFILLHIRRVTKTSPLKNDAWLLLKEDFGALPEDQLELEIKSLEDVAEAARKAEEFCIAHGQSPKTANHLALCIEEVAGNTVEHGFSGKGSHLSVRILFKGTHWTLRFRDDCPAFDPVHYTPKDKESALGIRLMQAMADEALYTSSLNLNNLTLKLTDPSLK